MKNEVLRHFIVPQLQEFRLQDTSERCPLCKKCLTAGDIHIDHEIHLAQLAEQFSRQFGPRTEGDEYVFIAAWMDYHRQHARLRKTCASCNLRRPKWKPNAPTCSICNNIERLTADGVCLACDDRFV